jgi:pimeloyl-ACP methyl ester carboxylesterase
MGLSLWTWISQHPYKSISIIIIIFIIAWLTFAAILLAASSKLIFSPQYSRNVLIDIPHEQLWLTNHKDQKIDTIWIKNPQASQIVLYLHGNRGRLSHFFPPLSKKYSVLAPAYPGFHNSEGTPTSDNVYSTALLAYDYLLRQGYQENQIIVFGHSLGGSPAVYTAAQRPSAGKLVLVNTFNSIYSMCVSNWGIGCIFAKNILNSAANAPFVYTKVREFHDINDDVVPYSEGTMLFSHFTGTCDKKFITLPKADSHSDFDILAVMETD